MTETVATETAAETTETPATPATPVDTEASESSAAQAVPEEANPTDAPAAEGEAAPAPEPHDANRPIQAVGRRKEAVVRVRLVPGTGRFDLDGRSLEAYFPNKVHQQLIKAPLVTVERAESFDVYAHLNGGGPSGQAGALRLAIARALILVQPEDRPVLKKAGFLTRDPRATERKKYGLKKARKAPQYSKR